MAGRDVFGADGVGVLEELAELEVAVADDARVRGGPAVVLADEVVDDLLARLL